ncbi:hypothetical protein, partial [Escherichia coli]
ASNALLAAVELANSESWFLRKVFTTELRVIASNALLAAVEPANSESWFLRKVFATELRVIASNALLAAVEPANSESWFLRKVFTTELRVIASNALLAAVEPANSESWFLRSASTPEFFVSASRALLASVELASSESWYLLFSTIEGKTVISNSFSLLVRDVFFSFIISHPKLTILVDKIRFFGIIVQDMNLSGQSLVWTCFNALCLEDFHLNALWEKFSILRIDFPVVSLAHRDMFSFLPNKKVLLMKENIPAVTRTRIDVGCCDSSAVFVLDNGHDHFAVSLETVLSCLKVAEEHGHVPEIGADWWCLIANHTALGYPS